MANFDDKILLCCSEASLKIRKAIEPERRDGSNTIILLMIDRYLLDRWEEGLAADLRSRPIISRVAQLLVPSCPSK